MIRVAFWDLEEAMSSGGLFVEWYLDRDTGQVT